MARSLEQRPSLLWGAMIAATLVSALAADASGQIVVRQRAVRGRFPVAAKARGDESAAEEAGENVFLRPDREVLKKLSDSRKLLAAGRFGEAVRNLDLILEGPEDFFIEPDKHAGRSRGLKAEAERLIGRMPREGRELYELQYGPKARQMLTEALAGSDASAVRAGLAGVSRQFFHTRSGYQATFLLGLHYLDHGDAMLAARTLQRLAEAGEAADRFEPALSLTMAAAWLQAGAADKAREVLLALRQRNPALRVTVAGRETPIFAKDDEALDWLTKLSGTPPPTAAGRTDNWLMFRGDAARNASMPGSAPLLDMRWRVLSTDNPEEEKTLERQWKRRSESDEASMPAFHPLAVGDVLLMRSLESLLAVDIVTGKLLWEVPVDEPDDRAANSDPAVSPQFQLRQQPMAESGEQRITSDLTYGTLSSDGRYVFSVEDVGRESAAPAAAAAAGGRAVFIAGGVMGVRRRVFINGINGMGNEEQPALCNLLAAHDIRSGKLKWQLGGPPGPHALPLAGTFFLGPPLPLHSRLYVLAENGREKGVIRLLALDAATGVAANGKPRWSQPLAMSDAELDQDPPRRLAGASPSYADGILVCPTASGAIVAIDLTTRSLLWGYCFSEQTNSGRRNMAMFQAMVSRVNEPSAPRWLDDSVSICDGRVLTTPDESEWLYCLDLVDGELLWKCRRKDDLYVACADRDKVVLVGRDAVRAVRLADGKPAWNGRVVNLPGGSTPSGRGFASGGRYFLPLSSAEVVGIDLAAGKIVQTAKSRKGTIQGNLICFKGNVISQGLEGVNAYYQLDAVSAEVERRLAANPDDAEALSLRGEILLDKGKRSAAVAAFVRASESQADPRTRELLRDAILEGLRSDFARYRDQAWRCERLADDASQRAAFFRAMAAGLQKSGELSAAFADYEKLVDAEPERQPLDEIDKSLLVRRDRWLRGRLGELRRDARGETAAKIDQAVATRFAAAKADKSLDPLRRFVDTFGDQPAAAAEARAELVRRLDSAGRRLEAEMATISAANRGDARNPPVAAQPAADRNVDWPPGKVEVKTKKVNNAARNNYGRAAFSLRGDSDPCFRDLSLQFDYNHRAILAYDPLGHEMWRVSLSGNEQQYYAFNSSWNHGRGVGHLLLVALGWKIVAIDTLGIGPKGGPRLLWTHDMTAQPTEAANAAPQPLGGWNWPQQQQFSAVHDQSKLLNLVCPGYLCVQRFHSVIALDPQNGEVLWSRQEMPFGCDLFGDDQYVFVLPPDTDQATVLRARDGEVLGKRRVPRIMGRQTTPGGEQKEVFGRFEETCLATLGRKMLLWWPEGNQRELTLADPLEGRDLWRGRKFAAKSEVCVVNHEVVGVMEPGGRFVLISLPDGRTIAELQLEPEPSLADIAIDAGPQQYLLLVSSSQGEANAQHFQPMPGSSYRPVHHGRLYAIDRHGKLQWPAPAVIKNQYLPANQPSGVPIVTFACQTYQPRPKGQSRYGASLLCIDKRNGRTVFEKAFDATTGLFEITGDAAKKTVEVTMQQDTVTFKFTNKPLPPAGDAAPGKASQSKAANHAVGDAAQKTHSRDGDDSGREGD